MRFVVQALAMVLLGLYPVGLSAQAVSYPPVTSSANEVTQAAYLPPAASSEKANADVPQHLPTAEKPPADTPSSLKLSAPAVREPGKRPNTFQSLITVGGSLAAVLGLFLLMVWAVRRTSPRGLATLPREAFEVLGRAPLANRQQAQLLRCGNKLLLVAVGAAGAGADTLTEITDPAEVERLADLCRQTRSGGPVATFRQALRQAEDRHA